MSFSESDYKCDGRGFDLHLEERNIFISSLWMTKNGVKSAVCGWYDVLQREMSKNNLKL